MEELTKLWQYLTSNGYNCRWYHSKQGDKTTHNQIVVYRDDDQTDRLWDAICHRGSHGYEQGLLEIYGVIVDPMLDGDNVIGYLTADEIIMKYIPRLK